MKDHPILFSAPMIRALLSGTKTQTRRILKPAFGPSRPVVNLAVEGESARRYSGDFNDPSSWGYPYAEEGMDMPLSSWLILCPYGKPGDLIWVRETMVNVEDHGYLGPVHAESKEGTAILTYGLGACADDLEIAPEDIRLRPSIHMPRSASRLTLQITAVRAQRLQDCSNEDAIAEGIGTPLDARYAAAHEYRALWESINGAGSWEANPWVWALTFEVIHQNIDSYKAAHAVTPQRESA